MMSAVVSTSKSKSLAELPPFERAKVALLNVEKGDARSMIAEIDKAVGDDTLYSLIANGMSVEELGAKLDLSGQEMKFLLTYGEERAKRFYNSRIFHVSDSAISTLFEKGFMESDSLEKNQYNAAKFHQENMRIYKDIKVEEEKSAGVTINNVVLTHKDNIPPLPEEIVNIIPG